jgi:hypothetical protein
MCRHRTALFITALLAAAWVAPIPVEAHAIGVHRSARLGDGVAAAARCPDSWPRPLLDMTGYRRTERPCATQWIREGKVARSSTARSILGATTGQLRRSVYDTVGSASCSAGGAVRYCTQDLRLIGAGDRVRGRITVSHDGIHRYSKVRLDVWRVD